MAWRLHLTERIVRRIDILPGKPNLLAAWTQPDRVYFMELHNGSKLTERQIEPPNTRATAMWGVFVKALRAANGVYLPLVRTPHTTVYQLPDGKKRLYRDAQVALEVDGVETKLDMGDHKPVALALDDALIAALDDTGTLYYFRGALRTAAVETKLRLSGEFQPHLAIVEGGTGVYVSDGEQIASYDGEGRLIKQFYAGYTIGSLACSPDGVFLATGDLDSNMIRVYDGKTLTPTHQRFAVELLADAKKTQAISSALAANTAVGSLVITGKGVIAFSMSGMVCATSLSRMIALPGVKPVPAE
jgi:hypothetical protein